MSISPDWSRDYAEGCIALLFTCRQFTKQLKTIEWQIVVWDLLSHISAFFRKQYEAGFVVDILLSVFIVCLLLQCLWDTTSRLKVIKVQLTVECSDSEIFILSPGAET